MVSSKQTRTIAVLTALPEETAAVRNVLGDAVWDNARGRDRFLAGSINLSGGHWRVLLIETGRGNYRSALAAVDAIRKIAPDYVAFVGIAGGLKDVAIGDVVVSSKLYAYEGGKEVANGFRTRPEAYTPARKLLDTARLLRDSMQWLPSAMRFNDRQPACFVEPIAAGEKVSGSRSGSVYTLVRRAYNDAYAIEMESAGLLYASHWTSFNNLIVIRGINDLCGGKGTSEAQGSTAIAAHNAAAFFKAYLSQITDYDSPFAPQIIDVSGRAKIDTRYTTVDFHLTLDIKDTEGREVHYNRHCTSVITSESTFGFYDPIHADGQISDFECSPGLLTEIITYQMSSGYRRFVVISRPAGQLERGDAIKRQFKCKIFNAFTSKREYWDFEAPYSQGGMSVTVLFPESRPALLWGIVDGNGKDVFGPESGSFRRIDWKLPEGMEITPPIRLWWEW